MWGLLILGGIVAYVWFFWVIATRFKSFWARAATTLVALLIPFWDFPIGLANFYQHCARDGGIKVEKDFHLGDSILLGKGGRFRPEELIKVGFKTVEFENRNEIIRYTATENGLVKSTQTHSISPIRYESSGWESMPWNLQRLENVIKHVADGKIVAKRTDFSWDGMWWERHVGFRGSPWSHCGAVPQKSLLIILKNVN
jgi:hypothetical protein